jgi:hypothetical protein
MEKKRQNFNFGMDEYLKNQSYNGEREGMALGNWHLLWVNGTGWVVVLAID